jgi:hypothetical protein
MRMPFPDLGIVIGPAVMAFGEEVDRVDLGRLEHGHEPVGIELGPDTRDMLRGMKINVNLAEREG